jgi:hypothetical protein
MLLATQMLIFFRTKNFKKMRNDISKFIQKIILIALLFVSISSFTDYESIIAITPSPVPPPPPSVATIASGTLASGFILAGTTNNVIYDFSIDATGDLVNITAIKLTTAGTYIVGDLGTNFTFWYSIDNIFDSASDFSLGTTAVVSSGSNVIINGFSQTVAKNNTGYFFLTTDIDASATAGNTINITSTANSNITTDAVTQTGIDPIAAGSVQTISVPVVAPVISSSLTAAGTVGSAFSYTITATNTPTSFSATGLPAGLSIDTGTGVISGTPTTAAVTNVTIGATNAGGSDSQTLVITISAAPVASGKVLFDGTSGQSDASADWVVDADSWDLDWYSSGTCYTTGTESNPQRYPTPAVPTAESD